MVKNPPASIGDAGSIPGSGRSLEKEMATHSSILAWEIPWTEKSLKGYSPWGLKESDMTERLNSNNLKRGAVLTRVSILRRHLGRLFILFD